MTDDTANVYAYARLAPDYSDAAIVVLNRATAAQNVNLNLAGLLHVVSSGDLTAPSAPTNLAITGASNSHISFAWDAHPYTDGDLAGFEVLRDGSVIDRLEDSAATEYSDTSVVSGQTYIYEVLAYDTRLNRSATSNSVTETASPRPTP